jgi:type IV pilus modification protein PilV
MKTFKFIKAPRGFSMIEVLISVVVLGFGLLALAALQTTIIRSSSETKAQTIALQLAKDKLEELRSFQNLTGYQALTTGNDAVNDSTGSLSGVNFTRTWLVTRFAYNPTTKAFVSVTPLVGATPTGGTTPSTYVANNEYKRVAVTVTWSDVNGASQSIGLEDALGAISPGDGSKVTLNNLSTSQARKPRVLIYDPGLTGGVIPIAIGNGSSTAASNPVPVLKGKTDAVAETLFEVLTYAGTSGNVLAQSRVETAVIGCTCSTANAPSSKGYRPTYWNGFRYAPPVLTTDNATAGWTVPGGTQNTAESDRCTACCRDHRDPSGVTGAKFDPWRTNHAHYLRVNNTTLTAAPTGTYSEACRLIRVDGFFRVASDFRNDYLGLLEVNNNGDITNTSQNLRAYSPKVDTADLTKDSSKKYEKFILNYMDDRFSNNALLTFNTPLATAGYEATYRLNSPYDNAGTTPVPIIMKPTAVEKGPDSKWSHARGLYIDWIEPEAKDIIKAAQDTCPAKTTQLGRNTCALPYVPFTSVNLTELADWKSKLEATDIAAVNAVTITVANNAFIDPITGDTNVPTRGNVYKGSAPVNNAKAFALSYITESNSGIALKAQIDIDEALLSDSQEYEISSSGTPPVTGVPFQITISNWNTASAPFILNYATNSDTCTTASSDPKFPNPYSCNFGNIIGDTQVKVTGYTKTSTVSVPNGCRTSGTVGLPIIVDYNVSGGTNPNGTAIINSFSGDKTINDTTVIYYNPVIAASMLTLQFSGPVRYCPSNYSSSVVNKTSNNAADPTGYACTNGQSVPTWSTTLVTCPSGTP